jgi:uncharacterized delta-60 repeat protein
MDLQVARYTSQGVLDPTFGQGGRVVSDFGEDEEGLAVRVQADGKIVVAGDHSTDWYNPRNSLGMVVRYQPDGTLDPTFGTGGRVLLTVPGTVGLALQPDGRIIVADRGTVLRLNVDGTLDRSFSNSPPGHEPPYVDLSVPMT